MTRRRNWFVTLCLYLASVATLLVLIVMLVYSPADAVDNSASSPTVVLAQQSTLVPVPTFTPTAIPSPTPRQTPQPEVTLQPRASQNDPHIIFYSSEPALNNAKDEALAILSRDLKRQGGFMVHSAGPGYDAAWIRDSFAGGMIPYDAYPQLTYTTSELRYWMNRQEPSGQWTSLPLSGYYDETALIIIAALDAYRVTGKRPLLQEFAPKLRKGWSWLRGRVNTASDSRSAFLLYTPLRLNAGAIRPPISVDWADQVARRNYAGQLNALWYGATRSMAVIESVLGNASAANQYRQFAVGIKTDYNRLFWTSDAPFARNAPPAPAFGHYRSWFPFERDYFEMDTNLQAILYGLADDRQADSILSFITANGNYLLGTPDGTPPPAKTLYGDYDPSDYASIKSKMGDGIYHNAYWMPIGGLAARAFNRQNQSELVQRTLLSLAHAFNVPAQSTLASEWYDAMGRPRGVATYQWSARAFLDALFKAYLGVEVDADDANAASLRVNPLFGDVAARMTYWGKTMIFHTQGSGAYRYALINGSRKVESHIIPSSLLSDGATIDLYLQEP